MNYVPEGPPEVRQAVHDAINVHVRNKNYEFKFGTRKLIFDINYQIPEYFIEYGRFSGSKPPAKLFDDVDRLCTYAQRNFWEREHDPERFLSFVKSLKVGTVNGGAHPLKQDKVTKETYVSQFLNPLRHSMDGDGTGDVTLERFLPPKIRDMMFVCAYCMKHPFPEDCRQYWTPLERSLRIRDINWTCFRHKAFQLCLSCLQREVGHVDYEKCLAQFNCCYCNVAGHHKSLCTSIVHVRALAKNRDRMDQKVLQQNMRDENEDDVQNGRPVRHPDVESMKITDNVLGIAAYMHLMYRQEIEHVQRMKDQVTAKYIEIDLEVKKCLNEEYMQQEIARRKALQDAADGIAAQDLVPMPPAHAEPPLNVRYEEGLGRRNAHENVPDLDEHDHTPVKEMIEENMISIRRFKFAKDLDRTEMKQTVKTVIERVRKLFKCSVACGSGQDAAYFCKCGHVHLCTSCTKGKKHGAKMVVNTKIRLCPKCNSRVVVPRIPDDANTKKYAETVTLLKRQLELLLQGFGIWSRTFTPSPDLVTYKKEVHPVFENIARQLNCQMCSHEYSHATRAAQKSGCECGQLICKACLVNQYIGRLVESPVEQKMPNCMAEVTFSSVQCRNCTKSSMYIGTCLGLTLLSCMTSYFLDVADVGEHRTIAELWKDKIEAYRALNFEILQDDELALIEMREKEKIALAHYQDETSRMVAMTDEERDEEMARQQENMRLARDAEDEEEEEAAYQMIVRLLKAGEEAKNIADNARSDMETAAAMKQSFNEAVAIQDRADAQVQANIQKRLDDDIQRDRDARKRAQDEQARHNAETNRQQLQAEEERKRKDQRDKEEAEQKRLKEEKEKNDRLRLGGNERHTRLLALYEKNANHVDPVAELKAARQIVHGTNLDTRDIERSTSPEPSDTAGDIERSTASPDHSDSDKSNKDDPKIEKKDEDQESEEHW